MIEYTKLAERLVAKMAKCIFVVDDEAHIRELITYNLEENGYIAAAFETGEEMLAALEKRQPALILLDIMLPGLSGLEVCKQLKRNPNTKDIPIIFLTAKAEEIDKVLGLELGGDDYISKPFGVRELIARIGTVLRRCEKRETKEADIIAVRDIVMNIAKRTVTKDDQPLTLTLKEFELLKLLILNKGNVFSRDVLLDKIWGYDYYGETRTVDVHIRNLRKALRDDKEEYIQTVRGIGYRFSE